MSRRNDHDAADVRVTSERSSSSVASRAARPPGRPISGGLPRLSRAENVGLADHDPRKNILPMRSLTQFESEMIYVRMPPVTPAQPGTRPRPPAPQLESSGGMSPPAALLEGTNQASLHRSVALRIRMTAEECEERCRSVSWYRDRAESGTRHRWAHPPRLRLCS